MDKNVKLSVCLIVKNEQDVLARILSRSKLFADEIVIVDTGSKDSTKDVAKKYTQNIYDFVWVQDFAKARNFSFDKAHGKYLMWLDADDYIDDENIKKILELKNSDMNFDFLMCKYKMNGDFVYYRERIIRNVKAYRWKGFLHEAISPCGKIAYSDITIEHRPKVENKDPKRNLKIYREHIKKGTILGAREKYYYARELYYNGYYSSCIKNLNAFFKCKEKFSANVVDGIALKARCYLLLKKYQKGINIILNYAKGSALTSEMCCIVGDCFLGLQKNKEGIPFYKMALDIEHNIEDGSFVDKSFATIYPSLSLCYIYYTLGDHKKAKEYHLLSKSFSPTHPSVLYNEKFFS